MTTTLAFKKNVINILESLHPPEYPGTSAALRHSVVSTTNIRAFEKDVLKGMFGEKIGSDAF
jgi:hypothetical protein